ncbi:MAG: T9SS type A sorting domain-containing protein [Fidelibacterota bacterium]
MKKILLFTIVFLMVDTSFDQVDTLGVNYSITTDREIYKYSDTINWSAYMINKSLDTLRFEGLNGITFFEWLLIDSSGNLWDTFLFIDSTISLVVPPGDSLIYKWETYLSSNRNPFPPGLYYGLMKPWYNYEYLPYDSTKFWIADSIPQIEITVSTDTSKYHIGDSIGIYITAYNSTVDSVTLHFATSCQSEYYIDGFYSGSYHGCYQAFTKVTIEPESSYTWYWKHSPENYQPGIGTHSIVGEVINYGFSDTIFITVYPSLNYNDSNPIPSKFTLKQNFPNPFNSKTTIEFSIPAKNPVNLAIYDVLGHKIETLINYEMDAGTYSIVWQSDNIPSGIYFITLASGDFKQMKKALLLK